MDSSIFSSSSRSRRKIMSKELTFLDRQWQPAESPPIFSIWMASSEVDQKYLGHFAKTTSVENNYLSSFLFRVLGLSVILAEKLLRARKARRLDPIRDPKARQLVHHILWLAREGLVMVEQYILPMVGTYVDLKVLAYKLRASFYHIFVLFHNDPPVNNRIARSRSGSVASTGIAGTYGLFPDPLSPSKGTSKSRPTRDPIRSPASRQRSPAISLGGAVGGGTTTRTPPGLPLPTPFTTNPYTHPTSSNSPYGYLTFLPLLDYTPHATAAFQAASALADNLLPGSHPVRLSVKVEYTAYVYDCLKEEDVSRRMARMAIRNVYEAREGMDDESFEDAAEIVGVLGKMMRRGLGGAGGSSGGASGSKIGNPPSRAASTGGGTNVTTSPRNGEKGNGNGNGHIRGMSEASISSSGGTGQELRSQQPTTWV